MTATASRRQGRVCRVRPAMGTLVALEADAPTGRMAEKALDAGFAAIRKVEVCMHPRREGSDLAAIHAARPGEPVAIDAWTWEVLALARHIATVSEGIFDPCLPSAPGRIGDVDLVAALTAIRRAELRLDLGGIAKGFAVDKAVEAMRSEGAESGIVNAGGDLRVFGEPGDVLLRLGRTTAGTVTLADAALAVSDPHGRSRPLEHAGYYLRTGAPRRARPAAVIAPSAALADALAKCALFGAEPDRGLFGRLGATVIG